MHVPVYGLRGARGRPATLIYTLDYRDPTGGFYVYERLALAGAGEANRLGTALLVAIVGRIAPALAASGTGRFGWRKLENVTLFQDAVHAAYVLRKSRCTASVVGSAGVHFREREVSGWTATC